jgi:hypothetical protein
LLDEGGNLLLQLRICGIAKSAHGFDEQRLALRKRNRQRVHEGRLDRIIAMPPSVMMAAACGGPAIEFKVARRNSEIDWSDCGHG